MYQIGWAAVGEIVPKKRRPLAIAIFEASVSPPGALGVLIGKIRLLIPMLCSFAAVNACF
jgi:hypothetical protein